LPARLPREHAAIGEVRAGPRRRQLVEERLAHHEHPLHRIKARTRGQVPQHAVGVRQHVDDGVVAGVVADLLVVHVDHKAVERRTGGASHGVHLTGADETVEARELLVPAACCVVGGVAVPQHAHQLVLELDADLSKACACFVDETESARRLTGDREAGRVATSVAERIVHQHQVRELSAIDDLPKARDLHDARLVAHAAEHRRLEAVFHLPRSRRIVAHANRLRLSRVCEAREVRVQRVHGVVGARRQQACQTARLDARADDRPLQTGVRPQPVGTVQVRGRRRA
jgi:hypothetical protein